MSDEEKITVIAEHQKEIMLALGLDLNDLSLKDTPVRVAKMLVKDLFKGLDPENFPVMKAFPNDGGYDQMLLQKNIVVQSMCEHHFVPFTGVAHVAYIPGEKVIGLSKINRVVDYFSRRPQLQERLTQQIAQALQESLGTEHVAVVLECKHLCYSIRGIKDHSSTTTTSFLGGVFRTEVAVREEFFSLVNS